MWNFAGRQNDIQGQGEIEHGNWITGIPFVDKFLVGDQSLLPSDLKNNKGHNVFYCLPLILGPVSYTHLLGTGLNAFLTLLSAEETRRKVHYTGIERYPLAEETLKQLPVEELICKAWFLGGRTK